MPIVNAPMSQFAERPENIALHEVREAAQKAMRHLTLPAALTRYPNG
jgi:hypothetical protein